MIPVKTTPVPRTPDPITVGATAPAAARLGAGSEITCCFLTLRFFDFAVFSSTTSLRTSSTGAIGATTEGVGATGAATEIAGATRAGPMNCVPCTVRPVQSPPAKMPAANTPKSGGGVTSNRHSSTVRSVQSCRRRPIIARGSFNVPISAWRSVSLVPMSSSASASGTAGNSRLNPCRVTWFAPETTIRPSRN